MLWLSSGCVVSVVGVGVVVGVVVVLLLVSLLLVLLLIYFPPTTFCFDCC